MANKIPLPCAVCGRNVLLLDNNRTNANVIMYYDAETKVVDINIACMVDCDRKLTDRELHHNEAWSHLDEWLEPSMFLKRWCALVNGASAQRISDGACTKIRDVLIAVAQISLNGEPVPVKELRGATFTPGI